MATHTLLNKVGLTTLLAQLKTHIPQTWAGSDSQGGSATTSKALTSDNDKGSSTQPVYFSSGKPQLCDFTVATSVPSGAKFTDTNTTYTAGTGLQLSGTQFKVKNTEIYQGLTTKDDELALSHDWIVAWGNPFYSETALTITVPRSLHMLVSWKAGMTLARVESIKGVIRVSATSTGSYSVPEMIWSYDRYGRFNGSGYQTGSTGMGTLWTYAVTASTVIAYPMTDKNFTQVDTSVAPKVYWPSVKFSATTNAELSITFYGTLPAQYSLLVFV